MATIYDTTGETIADGLQYATAQRIAEWAFEEAKAQSGGDADMDDLMCTARGFVWQECDGTQDIIYCLALDALDARNNGGNPPTTNYGASNNEDH
jgi:hypothetical protein|tara:strand:- start:310 stop:594 length:285 start_codon:yes stop_codon:yes gene_type:complete